jgi:hypothetical protein
MTSRVRRFLDKIIPEFLKRDYSPYECKVSALKENYSFNGSIWHAKNIIKTMVNTKKIPFPSPIQCKTCLFDTRFPNIYITNDGTCNMCRTYKKNFNAEALQGELTQFLKKEKRAKAQFDAIVAFSAGKDSSVSLYIAVREYKLKVLPVLVDNGFIPDEVIKNGQAVCDKLGVHLRIEKIDFMPKMQELYKTKFATGYPCNVCTILFHEAIARVATELEVNRVILGRNWWRMLDPKVQAVRRVTAPGADWDIDFMSLPFALQIKEQDQKKYLEAVGWHAPSIYGDSTNCLIPGLVEKIVYDRIGYHPELNLLSREVIVGFQPKEKALQKLSTIRDLSKELAEILEKKERGS